MKSNKFGLLFAGMLAVSPAVFAAQGGLGVGADVNVGAGAGNGNGNAGAGVGVGAGARTNGYVGSGNSNASGAVGTDANVNGAATMPKRRSSSVNGNVKGGVDASGGLNSNSRNNGN